MRIRPPAQMPPPRTGVSVIEVFTAHVDGRPAGHSIAIPGQQRAAFTEYINNDISSDSFDGPGGKPVALDREPVGR